MADQDDWYDDSDDNDDWDDDDDDSEVKWDDDDLDKDNIPSTSSIKKKQPLVKALYANDIQKQIDIKVKLLSDQLNINQKQSLLILRKYKWNSIKILNLYFNNMNKILIESGICIKPQSTKPINIQQIECNICMEDVDISLTFNIECGHINVCKNCWIDYLRDAVKTKQCVFITCPTYKCNLIVQSNAWQLLLSTQYPNDYQRYLRFCYENFIEYAKEYGFCPGKSCKMIYSYEPGVAIEINCLECKSIFCWGCKYDVHYPSSCNIAIKWLNKCSSESDNILWILAKTKKCPNCNVSIEKNQGCNHMTCRKTAGGCGHEFCWLCRGDWNKHGSNTGGYYKCNIYSETDDDLKQQNALNQLQRYEFHYTRYDSHINSWKHSLNQQKIIPNKMDELCMKFNWQLNDAQFLLDAAKEVSLCWHVLAWTYPIAYYANVNCLNTFNIDLFKDSQGKLEYFCNGIQQRLDFDLVELGNNAIRQQVITFMRAAKQFRQNLVAGIENEII